MDENSTNEIGKNVSGRFWKQKTKKYKKSGKNKNREKSAVGKTMSNEKYIKEMKKNKVEKKSMKELEDQIKQDAESKKQVFKI